MLMACLAPQDLQLPCDAIKVNEDVRQSGPSSPAMWAEAEHEFLLLVFTSTQVLW